jgi:DNA topoisomerase II
MLISVFPLRGKLLNVRDASHEMIMKNAEINAIRQIMGLQHGKKYEDTKSLRYGHLMIMTDQDHDGSHIKGLIINYFETFYPSLLAIPGFLIEFITPIVKVTKAGKDDISFFTMPEYEYWKENTPDHKKWKMKYYKVCLLLSVMLIRRVLGRVRTPMPKSTFRIWINI